MPAVVSAGFRTTDLLKAEVSMSAITLSLRLPRHCAQCRKIRCFTDNRGAVHSAVETYSMFVYCYDVKFIQRKENSVN